MPFFDLADMLGMGLRGAGAKQAVVVRRGREPFAFALDRVAGQQESVVRPLLDPLIQVRGVSGATDLGDGRPTLVLDLVTLGASVAAQSGVHAS